MAILQRNWRATGEGIALPEIQGGSPCLLNSRYRRRIRIHNHDVTRYNFNLDDIENPVPDSYPALPFSTKFDLTILDAHRFESGNEILVAWEPQRMLISQLIIALEYTSVGGVIVIRLGNPHSDQTAAILYILKLLFHTVKAHKPTSSHNHRGSFYAVAGGFQKEMTKDRGLLKLVREVLCRKWWEATFGGEAGRGINPGEWWEEIVPTDKLPELFGETLVELALPIWATQIEGLRTYFTKHGINS